MNKGFQEHLNKSIGAAAQTVTGAKTTTISGSLTQTQLEDLLRNAVMHNVTVSVVSGTLTVTTN